jgi:hypothetical protein
MFIRSHEHHKAQYAQQGLYFGFGTGERKTEGKIENRYCTNRYYLNVLGCVPEYIEGPWKHSPEPDSEARQ